MTREQMLVRLALAGYHIKIQNVKNGVIEIRSEKNVKLFAWTHGNRDTWSSSTTNFNERVTDQQLYDALTKESNTK